MKNTLLTGVLAASMLSCGPQPPLKESFRRLPQTPSVFISEGKLVQSFLRDPQGRSYTAFAMPEFNETNGQPGFDAMTAGVAFYSRLADGACCRITHHRNQPGAYANSAAVEQAFRWADSVYAANRSLLKKN
jgi:hypothetical protein